MLSSVVDEMAPLTERLQVPRPILGRIMVEVRTGKHYARLKPGEGRGERSGSRQPPQGAASAGAPDLIVLVPPAPVSEMGSFAGGGEILR